MVWAREPLEGRGQLQRSASAFVVLPAPKDSFCPGLPLPGEGLSTVGTLPLGIRPWTSCSAAGGPDLSEFFTD